MKTFYRRRDFQPAWIRGEGLAPEAVLLADALHRAGEQGLDPETYRLADILQRLPSAEAEPLAELDLLLSSAFLTFSRDLLSGRKETKNADPKWFLESDRIDHLAAMERALPPHSLGKLLDGLTPEDPGYFRLQESLARYRAIAGRGGWPSLPNGPLLKRGAAGPAVALLRQRLAMTGDLAHGGDTDGEFDAELEKAVRHFQGRHGFKVDGIVGPVTRAALNIPVEGRIDQILLNLERRRWMPRDLGRRYLLVNMAGFELKAVEDGRAVLRMRVIVGRAARSTPAFSESMTYMVFNPFWNIPTSIAVRDVLPKILQDPEFLARQKIRVFSDWSRHAEELDPNAIDWTGLDANNFPFKLRQDPGPENPLGQIKFMLPNRFAVYLHDTPHRQLFDATERTFSSGCIRLEKPLDLAEYVLDGDPAWPREAIATTLESGEHRAVSLPEPITVYLVYWTAWVDEDGTLQFRKDVYERDDLLQAALQNANGPAGSNPAGP
ncbi:L,D-transpeptidase family protein [Desulfuromonas sp.]|uniref:L,D-transpeptidase family protein n=1 Tax=Desulfuromonas sp. TaxID=892 RepID=UPI00342CCB4E